MKDLYNKSYRNPFSGVNAVQLGTDKILEYWCSPFIYQLFSEIKEEDIYNDVMNIVFMGGRSTGKSMFLRYWSYPVQFRKAEKENKKYIDIIKKNNGIGFYFRIDGPILRSFQGNGLSEDKWTSIFTHYFELVIGRQYLEVISNLVKAKEIKVEHVNEKFLLELNKLLHTENTLDLNKLIKDLDERISEVDTFRGNVAFYQDEFKPKYCGFASKTLSFGIAKLITKYIDAFNNLNIILLLDEYENFLKNQQIVINTLLKFTEPNIKFRIGMRLEGFRTYETINPEDFIKETREYRKVVFEEVLNKGKGYHEYLMEISRKRLESISVLKEKGFVKIEDILSAREDLELEAINLSQNSPNKIYEFLSSKLNRKFPEELKYSENPLLELLNYVWLIRGIKPSVIKKSMEDYLNKKSTINSKKYKRDYVDKYKLTLLFLFCSIHRMDKQYYSFNTFAFLSSGIVGHFIELCRRSFAIAGWGDDEKLLNEGVIPMEYQSKAAYDFSYAEIQQVNRIEKYGGYISQFIENIGNIFREYHRDLRMRYPETNQFAINIDSFTDENLKDIFKSAIKWSVIQKKPKMQRTGPSEPLQKIYTINRIFSPSFRISYRTRGGKSIILSESLFKILINDEKVDPYKFLPQGFDLFDDDINLNLFSNE